MKTKSILMVQHEDGTREATCKCGKQMIQLDLGVNQSIQAGEYIEEDLGWVWHCESCGHTEDG